MQEQWFTSDLHLGHANMIKPDYCDRPWGTVEDMNEALIENWNSVVGWKDKVWVLGDFSFTILEDEARGYFDRLNGQKNLIIGNHDSNWIRHWPWSTVYDLHWFKFNRQRYVLCHYPLESWQGEEKGSIHLHGHTHGRTERGGDKRGRWDVGVDSNNYRPISIQEVLGKMS